MRVLTLAIAGLTVAACHLVFPHAPGGGSGSTREIGVPVDALSRDGAPRTEQPALKPDLTCNLEQDPLPVTGCPPPGTVPDGDGLPDGRDPWPEACNPVVYRETFYGPSWPASWGRSYCDESHEVITCGAMRFRFPGAQTQWVWTAPSLLPSPIRPADLVEMRFLAAAKKWEAVGFRVSPNPLPTGEPTCGAPWSFDAGQDRTCWVRFEGSALTLHSAACGDSCAGTEQVGLPGWPGSFVLQSYVLGGFHRCMLFGDGTLLAYANAPIGMNVLPDAHTVLIQVASDGKSTLDVDYLRIFGWK